jgi:hypothetical protein
LEAGCLVLRSRKGTDLAASFPEVTAGFAHHLTQ